MTTIPCKVCHSASAKKMVDWRKYQIFKCKNCKLLFSHPDPSAKDLNDFYQGFLHRKPKEKDLPKLLDRKKDELKRRFNFSYEIPSDQQLQPKFLDYGGGTGIAYQAARLMGLDAYYQDIDQDSIAFVKKHFGLPEEKFITAFSDSTPKFDYIFSDNVIEHVLQPEAFIRQLVDQLAPGGVLLIKTPNAGNTTAYFYPRATIEGYLMTAMKHNSIYNSLCFFLARGWHCDPPRHLFSFSEKSFKTLMDKMNITNNSYSIKYYQHPLFEFSFTKSYFFIDREYKGISSLSLRIVLFPIMALELLSKAIQFVLQKLKLLSPIGLILEIKKF